MERRQALIEPGPRFQPPNSLHRPTPWPQSPSTTSGVGPNTVVVWVVVEKVEEEEEEEEEGGVAVKVPLLLFMVDRPAARPGTSPPLKTPAP